MSQLKEKTLEKKGTKKTALGWNLLGGRWAAGDGPTTRNIANPADKMQLVAAVREASVEQVDAAVAAAASALPGWKATPAPDRARVVFQFRELLERHFDELVDLLVKENGKLKSEARGSIRRGIDVVEFACGIPSQLM